YRTDYPTGWTPNEAATKAATARLKSRTAAYALYVLAKSGRGDLARLRWWHDIQMKQEASPIARAQVAAGLALMGDQARARSALQAAVQTLGYRDDYDGYQSPARDLAGVIAYGFEAGQPDIARGLEAKLDGAVSDPDRLNTQEQARLIQAAHAMLKAA